MNKLYYISIFSLIIAFFLVGCKSQNNKVDDVLGVDKEIYLPKTVWSLSENNDYNHDSSHFNNQHMKTTSNIAAYWDKNFGSDPSKHKDADKRFDIDEALKEGERFYRYFVDSLKFVDKGNSLTDKYKMLLYILNDSDQTAYAGGEEDKVGVMWFRPARMKSYPYCTLAHEMGHAFQYMVHADGAWGFTSSPEGSNGHSIFEMTSQWMLWQVYPDWMTIENYHLKDFMKKTHYAFLHETNMYHSPYVLEYWSYKHGIDIIGRIWREAFEGEDPVMTYKRLTGINQKTFNDEMFDAYRRFVTWDIDRIRNVAGKYVNQHSTKLNKVDDGWYQIDESNCPQNYGYNAIKLIVPKEGTKINLKFKGIAGAKGFRIIQVDKAGWRYGFLTQKSTGERIYSEMGSDAQGEILFTVPEGTEFLWLVVSGAPSEHWEHLLDGNDMNDEQWPYKIKISGTDINLN